MVKLVFDIETIPQDESVTLEEENREKYSLNKKYARILCIGYIKMANELIRKEVIPGNEPEVLSTFWEIAKDVDVFVGHNIFEFDLPIILYRSITHNVRPTRKLRLLSYHSERGHIYDTQLEGKKRYGRYISLEELAKLLSIEPLGTKIDGSKVYSYHKAGLDKLIYEYCIQQVAQTFEIYSKMILI
jgi:predicted PolB exonuclease-like 3'-5' exonuclease